MYAAAIVVSVCGMLNGDYDTSKWLLPWSVPFDTNNLTVFQWYLLWFTQFSFGFAYSSSTLTVTSFFVCGCFYLTALCDHFTFLIETIKSYLEINQNEEKPVEQKRAAQVIGEIFCEAIELHNRIYE